MSSHFAKIPSVNDLLENLAEQLNRIDQYYIKKIIDNVIIEIKYKPDKFKLQEKSRESITSLITDKVKKQIDTILEPTIRRVINATGVILHTGLGRAPLGSNSIEYMKSLKSYTNLEIRIQSGKRGNRLDHIIPLLKLITGSEDAVVVNNNAAAVLLILNTMARRKEVIVSRGELVEIGGSFRMPEVMKSSGAKMVEVGATNKTHLPDYEAAISEKTAAIMLVHPSNYKIVGFAEKPEIKDITELAHKHNIPVIYDVGSGALLDMKTFGFEYEPVIEDMIQMGIDIISFSGDKLLGGPQAGIIVGRSEWITKIKRNHLLRALRCDKITLGILSEILQGYLYKPDLLINNPSLNLLNRDMAVQQGFAKEINSAIINSKFIKCEIVKTTGKVGSGAYPVSPIDASAIKITAANHSAENIAQKLRQNKTPIFGYIENNCFYLNMLTIFTEDIPEIISALARIK